MSAVEWSDLAISDLQDIDDYWSAYSQDAAERIADRIERAAAFLIGTPHAGRALSEIDARKWGVGSTRYILIYRIVGSGIEILRVQHAQQDWERV